MGDKYLIAENFHVFIPQGKNDDGSDKPDRKRAFTKGMIVEAADIPEGHTGDDWVAKGLATAA